MANSYFKFKQFTIQQDHDGLKVCTDGCLFGAVIEPGNAATILDIGTGTGLLSLMLAQKSVANITAIEIDKNASIKALENISASPWYSKVKLIEGDINEFEAGAFDLIVSNPPFFQNSLRNTNKSKNTALHADSLSLEQLAAAVNRLSHSSSLFWVLLPEFESLHLQHLMEALGWSLQKSYFIKDQVNKPVIRVINSFGKSAEQNLITEQLIIRQQDHQYTEEFVTLLKPYYLYL